MNFLQKLVSCYEAAVNCDLVKTKQITNENLKKFRSILNNAQPSRMEEYYYKNMIYVLFGRNIEEFYAYIMSHGMPYFVLWMNSKYIINHFELEKLVYMKWSKGLYYTYKYRPKPTNQTDSQVEDEMNPAPAGPADAAEAISQPVSEASQASEIKNEELSECVEKQIEIILA